MEDKPQYATPQEAFWAGTFGTEYIGRNRDPRLFASNVALFAEATKQCGRIVSCLEVGANIGLNLQALQLLYPGIDLFGVEINPEAAKQLSEAIGASRVFEGSIFDYPVVEKRELVLTKGLLIHIPPEMLSAVYDKIYSLANRYVLLCEYYNPALVAIPYRERVDRLWKNDYAGDMLDSYPNLKLVDYGFVYHRDGSFSQDDISWFLMEKE